MTTVDPGASETGFVGGEGREGDGEGGMGLRGEDGSLMGGARGLLRGPSAFELLIMEALEETLKPEGEEEEEQGQDEDEGSLME